MVPQGVDIFRRRIARHFAARTDAEVRAGFVVTRFDSGAHRVRCPVTKDCHRVEITEQRDRHQRQTIGRLSFDHRDHALASGH